MNGSPETGSDGIPQAANGQLLLFPSEAAGKRRRRGPHYLPFVQLDSGAELPNAQYTGDAGLDLRSTIDVDVAPGERVMVPTGVAVAIPRGHAGLILPRSGLASKVGLTLSNAPGLVDAGYRGELVCSVVNLDRDEPAKITRGDRIAQLVVVALPQIMPVWAEKLPGSDRGRAGFGSTGTS